MLKDEIVVELIKHILYFSILKSLEKKKLTPNLLFPFFPTLPLILSSFFLHIRHFHCKMFGI